MTGAGNKKKNGGGHLPAFHPNLFTYTTGRGPASTVPPSYIALGRACVAENPLVRPTFDEVLGALEVVRRDSEQMQGEAAAAAATGGASPVAVLGQPGGRGVRRRAAVDGSPDTGGLERWMQGGEAEDAAAAAAGASSSSGFAPECVSMNSLVGVVATDRARGMQLSSVGLDGGPGSTLSNKGLSNRT